MYVNYADLSHFILVFIVILLLFVILFVLAN